MRNGKWIWLCCVFVLCGLVLFGCKKKSKEQAAAQKNTVKEAASIKIIVDENKPIAHVRVEAASMSTGQLREIALKYKEAITAKQAETQKLVVGVVESRGKVEDISDEMNDLSKSVHALTERLKIYVNELKARGGDVSGLE